MQTYRDLNVDYQLMDTPEKRKELVSTLLQYEEICLDTETTSPEAIDARLVGLSFSVKENQAWYVPVMDDASILEEFRPIYENPTSLKVGQNLKYDLEVLQNYGIELKGKMFDTMIAHYLLHPEMRHGMDYLAEAYLHYRTIHIEELIGSGKKQKSMMDFSPSDVYI